MTIVDEVLGVKNEKKEESLGDLPMNLNAKQINRIENYCCQKNYRQKNQNTKSTSSSLSDYKNQ